VLQVAALEVIEDTLARFLVREIEESVAGAGLGAAVS
jgi:hypothetical protein